MEFATTVRCTGKVVVRLNQTIRNLTFGDIEISLVVI